MIIFGNDSFIYYDPSLNASKQTEYIEPILRLSMANQYIGQGFMVTRDLNLTNTSSIITMPKTTIGL